MIQQHEGENIEFVFLCLGVDKNQWEQIIHSISMQGTQYFTENQDEISTLMRGFQIHGLPFYALANQQGYIIETGHYLRPMSPVTLAKINDLLHEQQ